MITYNWHLITLSYWQFWAPLGRNTSLLQTATLWFTQYLCRDLVDVFTPKRYLITWQYYQQFWVRLKQAIWDNCKLHKKVVTHNLYWHSVIDSHYQGTYWHFWVRRGYLDFLKAQCQPAKSSREFFSNSFNVLYLVFAP